MEKEISSGTMLGIVLIALAAVIGLGFGVFSIAKGVANEGTVGVQDNLAAVSESSFDDYNDKIVTGTMVRSAVTNFSGKSVAILINTTAMDKGVIAYKEHAYINAYKLTNGAGKLGSDAALDGCVGQEALADDKASTGEHYYINYNALLGDVGPGASTTSGGTTSTNNYVEWTSAGNIELKDGIFNASECPFAVDATTGKIAFDYSVGGFSRTGNCEYLNATAKFDANLIKDDVGTTIGIVFTQRVN